MSLEYSYLVVGPIGIQAKEEDIEMELKESGWEQCTARRIMKGFGDNAKPTVYIKLMMPQKLCPRDNKIRLFHEVFETRPYVDKPWQCYRCQQFGHNAKYCTKPIKCVICAERHSFKDCPNKREKERVKCVNCGMNHTSSYGGCKFMKDEKAKQLVKAQENITYKEAVVRFIEKRKSQAMSEEDASTTRSAVGLARPSVSSHMYISRYLDSQASQTLPENRPGAAGMNLSPKKVGVSTQTVSEKGCNTSQEQGSEQEVETFQRIILEKLQSCLLEIFAGTEKSELSKKTSVGLVTKAIKMHLSATVPEMLQLLKHREVVQRDLNVLKILIVGQEVEVIEVGSND